MVLVAIVAHLSSVLDPIPTRFQAALCVATIPTLLVAIVTRFVAPFVPEGGVPDAVAARLVRRAVPAATVPVDAVAIVADLVPLFGAVPAAVGDTVIAIGATPGPRWADPPGAGALGALRRTALHSERGQERHEDRECASG
jgi:hypothetical protein